MSAREKLLRVLRGQEDECYCDSPHCTPPEVLVDAYAHELAEKQRAKAGQLAILRSEDMRLKAEGLRMGADLIDPEVLNSGEA